MRRTTDVVIARRRALRRGAHSRPGVLHRHLRRLRASIPRHVPPGLL